MEEVLRWGAYVITGVLAWWGKDMSRKLEQTREEAGQYRLHVAETYLKKDELKDIMQPVLRKLDKIEEYLLHSRNREDKQDGV